LYARADKCARPPPARRTTTRVSLGGFRPFQHGDVDHCLLRTGSNPIDPDDET
jgi:hypothetical protein